LLHDVVIVEDLHAARTLQQEQPHLSAVTNAGDLLAPDQARGGAAGGPSVLGLHAARDEAAAALADATARIESTRFQLGPAREALQEAQAEVDRTLADLLSSDATLAAVADQLGQLGSRMRSARSEEERIRPAIEQTEEEHATRSTQLAELTQRPENAQAEPETDEGQAERATTERDQRAEAAKAARRAET